MNLSTELRPAAATHNFLQTAFWGRFKGAFGWKSYHLECVWNGKKIPFLALSRSLPGGLSLGYVPLPDFSAVPEAEFTDFLKALSRELQGILPMGALFVRWDLLGEVTGDEEPLQLEAPFKKSLFSVQPPDTVVLDLRPSEDELLAGMKSKTRYNVALAEKKGVVVTREGANALPIWYSLYQETAKRDHILIHSLAYYQAFFTAALEDGLGPVPSLYLARHEDDVLAGIVTLFTGENATYVYGASGSVKRNLMASYALQWRAICDAKKAGCLRYDFFGIPPSAEADHPMHGLYQFKTGWGGAVVRRMGAWDYGYGKLLFPLYRAFEKMRANKREQSKKPDKK